MGNNKNGKYQQRVKILLNAIETAEEIVSGSKLISEDDKRSKLNYYKELKEMVLFPLDEYRNTTSLSYLENDFLIFWNEGAGEDIENFWNEATKKNILYQRKDVFKEVLRKKKIKDIHQYDIIIDGLVYAKQSGKISEQDLELINIYISDFEKKFDRKNK